MKQLRKVSVILVALVLFTGASSVLVGCKHSAETSATTENKHHPAEEIVWKNDDESWGEEYIYFEPLSETAGKYYFCYKKNSSYWNKTHTSIFDYTRNGDSFKIDGTPIAYPITVSGNTMTMNGQTYTKVTSPTPGEVKIGAANFVEPS